MENQAKVEAKIEELSAQFDFVILAEFFDEGLVILARLLCWELEDVSHKTITKACKISNKKNLFEDCDFSEQVRYLKQNARTASKVNNITEESRQALTVILFSHSLQKLHVLDFIFWQLFVLTSLFLFPFFI